MMILYTTLQLNDIDCSYAYPYTKDNTRLVWYSLLLLCCVDGVRAYLLEASGMQRLTFEEDGRGDSR